MGYGSLQTPGHTVAGARQNVKDQAAIDAAWRQNQDGSFTNSITGVSVSGEERAATLKAAADAAAATKAANNHLGFQELVSGASDAIQPTTIVQAGRDTVSALQDPAKRQEAWTGLADLKNKYLDPLNVVGDPGNLGKYIKDNGGGFAVTTDYNDPGGRKPGPATTAGGAAPLPGSEPKPAAGGTVAGNLADSEAGKRASAQAALLADKFNAMPAPTYVSPTKVTSTPGQAQESDATVTATPVTSRDVNYQPGFQAPQIDKAPTVEKAGMIDPNALPMTKARDVEAPPDVKAGTVTATTIGPQRQDRVADISQDSLGRSAQQEALDRYRGVADGTAPSAAQALLRQSTDESIGAQLGMAATLQGNTPGLALRSGLSGAANALAKSGSAMAALRAQEQETGRAGFLTAATGIRTGDIDIAKSNQTTQLTTAANDLQAQVDVLKANQQAALDAGKTNVANDLQAQIQNATNKLDAAKANAVNSLNSDIANLTATLDASKANQATEVSQNIANLNAQMETLKANLQAAVSVGNANEANRVQSLIADANRELEAQKANQQALLDAAKANMQNTQYNTTNRQQQLQYDSTQKYLVDSGNSDREIQAQQVNNGLYTSMGQLTNNALGLPLGATQHDIDVAAAKANADTAGKYALGGAALGVLGKYMAS